MKIRRALSFGALLLLGACSTDPNADEVLLETGLGTYATPGVIDVHITNNGSSPVFGVFCPASLERRVADGWEPTLLGEPCATVAIAVPSGHTLSLPVVIDDDLPAGEYQVMFGGLTNEAGDQLGGIRTGSFQIE